MKKKEAPPPQGLQTKAIHASEPYNKTNAVSPPIWQTSTFSAESAAQFGEAAQAIHPTEFYTRYGNPIHQQIEATVASLEGGEHALALASGMGAIFGAVASTLQRGDHVVAQDHLYAGALTLFREVLPRWGIETTFVDQTDTGNFLRAIRPQTKLIYLETPSNPVLQLTDLRAVAEIAKNHGLLTIVDNTIATPINQRPLELGIDVVIHSATKYLGGHHDLMAGVIVAPAPFIERAWNFGITAGTVLSPFDGWLLLRGLRTLGLRVERHNSNAGVVARFLESHPQIKRVNYPGLETHPQYQLARSQMSGFGGVMSIEVQGGFEAAERFILALKLIRRASSLGGVETLVVHPAAMWSHQLSPEQRRDAGISESLIRVSVGLEDVADLLADFAQALDQ
jgi:cystathionine beta-lyase/cystathionine gamma-synthase